MLLNEVMRNKVDKNKYDEINSFDFLKQADERVRLFMALGSSDSLDAKKLVAFIEEKTGVEASNVTNVRVFERFSFFDVARFEGELKIKELKRSKAKPRKNLLILQKRRRNVLGTVLVVARNTCVRILRSLLSMVI